MDSRQRGRAGPPDPYARLLQQPPSMSTVDARKKRNRVHRELKPVRQAALMGTAELTRQQ